MKFKIVGVIAATALLGFFPRLSMAQEISGHDYLFLKDFVESLGMASQLRPCLDKLNLGGNPALDSAEKVDGYRQCYEDAMNQLRPAAVGLLKYLDSPNRMISDAVEK